VARRNKMGSLKRVADRTNLDEAFRFIDNVWFRSI
jgi:hypothetical protein